jgi:hypothetical protein
VSVGFDMKGYDAKHLPRNTHAKTKKNTPYFRDNVPRDEIVELSTI